MTNEQLKDFIKYLNETGIENIKNIVSIKNNATNGDVIKALFPNSGIEVTHSKGWWDSLYQKDEDNE